MTLVSTARRVEYSQRSLRQSFFSVQELHVDLFLQQPLPLLDEAATVAPLEDALAVVQQYARRIGR